jgi:chromosomal replication initiation ATPase DnaA
MIGLTFRGARLYSAIVKSFNQQGRSLSRADVSVSSGIKPSAIDAAMAPLIRRGFVRITRSGHFVACDPPHETVCAAVCEEMSVSLNDVRGSSKLPKLVRARRMITKRLRCEHRYLFAEIAKVINRHQSSVEEYIYRERAANRSKRRIERFHAQKEREMGLAA